LVVIALVCFAGAMSDLTVGYLSIDTLILELKISDGNIGIIIYFMYFKEYLYIVKNKRMSIKDINSGKN